MAMSMSLQGSRADGEEEIKESDDEMMVTPRDQPTTSSAANAKSPETKSASAPAVVPPSMDINKKPSAAMTRSQYYERRTG